jgi:selenophosphate synthetase-related protein
MPSLEALAAAVRTAPGLQSKRELKLIRRLGGAPDGDDAALIPRHGEHLVVCGEAILPSFVAAEPYEAGVAAVATNVADVRAMGGRPLALVDMLVSPDREHAQHVIDGLAWAADRLAVPVVGGHLTLGHPAALSASCTGVAAKPLRAANARPGDVLLAAFALDGEYFTDADFFGALRTRAPERLREDGEALVEVAEQGLCHAARDVSMPGVAGSLLQLLEAAGCGATLDLDRLPHPPGTALERWLVTFPSFGFVLAAPPQHAAAASQAFTRRGLTCAECGSFDASRALKLATAGATAAVWDLAEEPLTGLAGP